MDMGMGGAITAVAAITMVGTAAITMAGGIIAIGGDFRLMSKKGLQLAASFSLNVINQGRSQFVAIADKPDIASTAVSVTKTQGGHSMEQPEQVISCWIKIWAMSAPWLRGRVP
jgi:hypothetical protein